MALPAGGLLGESPDVTIAGTSSNRQTFSIGQPFAAFNFFNRTTSIVDDVKFDIATGSIGIAPAGEGQTDRYRLDAQIQIVFPRSNSLLEVAFFRDDIQVSDGVILTETGNIHTEGLVANAFTWVNIRARNAATAGDFGAQDNLQPIFQSIRFHIKGE